MTLQTTHVEIDDLGGRKFRSVINMRPIAYRGTDGYLRRIISNWADGDINFPHVVTTAQMMTYTAGDGMRRICPIGDPERYAEIGAPFVKVGGVWTKVNLGVPIRTANRLTWTTAQANVHTLHAGHFIKLGIQLKNDWRPSGNQFAFPVGLHGLTRSGGQLFADGVPVMNLRPFTVADMDNSDDIRQVAHDFVQVGGQWYIVATLPTLEMGKRWLIDPTLVLQPNAADGKDTFLSSFNATRQTYNYGVETRLIYGGTFIKGLIEFDLSSILSNAICSSASLKTYQVQSGAASAFTITIYSIAVGNAAWIEGTQDGTVALAGEPCWDALAADGVGGVTTAWAGSAGLATSGTDYEAVSIGSFFGNVSDANGTEYTSALTASRIQGWFGAVNTNYGMLVVTSATPGALGASDHATAAFRPQLTIEYTLGGRALKSLLNRNIL